MAKFSNLVSAEAGGYVETEWQGKLGGTEVRLLSKPLTPNDFEYVSRRTKNPNFMNSPTTEGMVELIIRKAKSEDGEAAFSIGDKTVMMHWRADLIGEIFQGLFADSLVAETEEDFEDRVKN